MKKVTILKTKGMPDSISVENTGKAPKGKNPKAKGEGHYALVKGKLTWIQDSMVDRAAAGAVASHDRLTRADIENRAREMKIAKQTGPRITPPMPRLS